MDSYVLTYKRAYNKCNMNKQLDAINILVLRQNITHGIHRHLHSLSNACCMNYPHEAHTPIVIMNGESYERRWSKMCMDLKSSIKSIASTHAQTSRRKVMFTGLIFMSKAHTSFILLLTVFASIWHSRQSPLCNSC